MTIREKTPLVCLISAGEATDRNFNEQSADILETIERAVAARLAFVQIREKRLPARLLLRLVGEASLLTRNSATRLLVNDRADVALAAGADGVHLTARSMPAAVVRAAFPPGFVIGVSTHSLAEARTARAEKADFAFLSPIFASPGKGAPLGLEALREAQESLRPFPVLGLGGVDESNYRAVLEAASGFAAIRFLRSAENLRKLKENFEAAERRL